MGNPENEITHIIKSMIIPDYILKSEARPIQQTTKEPPTHPVLVFINSKSGGQLGHRLLSSYCSLLNPLQVFDLAENCPEEVLKKILSHLEKLKSEGDRIAVSVRENLRIIEAGGDGTAGWILRVIGDMKLSHPLPVATVPLGTGNNIPYSLGWGRKNPGTDLDDVKNFLLGVFRAKTMNIDSWRVVIKVPVPEGVTKEPIQLPQSVHDSDSLHEKEKRILCGDFWNYFSIGMDAQVAYKFHRQRQQNLGKFKKQFINEVRYASISCTQGWFCARCTHPYSRTINHIAKIRIAQHKGAWEDLVISSKIRSIIMLNLPSFSGGLNPWGDPSDKKSKQRGLTPPYVDDGLLEIVGFRDGWHGLALLLPSGHGHGTRLAQAHGVRIEFHKSSCDHTYMHMDGEPWRQPLPQVDGETTIIEIRHSGQAAMLTSENCIAKPLPK